MKRFAALVTSAVAVGAAAVPLMPRGVWASALCNTPTVSSLSVQGVQQQHAPAGATVTVNGSGFSPGVCSLLVNVGPQSVPNPSTDGSHITFTTGPGWNGQVSVTLRDANGGTNTDSHLVFITDPVFNGVDNSAPTTSAVVHLTGQGFQFGLPAGWEQTSATYRWTTGPGGTCAGAPSSAPSVTDDSHISVQVPSQYCDGAVDVYVSAPTDAGNPGGSSRTTFKFTGAFDIAAHVSGMSRSSAVPGQTVSVTGSGFGNQGGGATVNGSPATVQSWSDTGVNVVVPSSATSGTLDLVRSVDRAHFSPGSLGVNAAVSGVSPSQASVGDTVTVSGAGFGTQAGSVSVAGTTASVQQWSPSSIVFTLPDGVPPGGTTVAISTSGTNAPAAPPFSVLPRITGVTPGHASAGSLIEIDGTSFGTSQGSVQVGGQSGTVTLWGDKSVLVSLPSSLGTGSTTISLAPPNSAAASYPYSIDAPPPPGAKPGGGSTSGGSSSGSHTSVSGTPGVTVSSNGLILPDGSGPVIAHGPVQFVKPSPPPGPVSLKLDTTANQSDPGTSVPFTVTLVAFGKPVVGAPVDLLLVIEPGSDASLDPAHAVTDAQGRVTGIIHLSKTAGDHIVLARSGIYSDEVRVVGRGAGNTVASGHVGGVAGDGSSTPSLVSVRSPVVWALLACVLLFGAGFGLNLMTAPAVAGGAAGAAGRSRDARETLRDGAEAAGSLARYGAAIVAVVGSLAVGALRRR
jgi:hypothetical protein